MPRLMRNRRLSRIVSKQATGREDGAESLLSALVDQISLAPSISLPRSLRAGLLEILFTSLHRETVYLSLCTLLEHKSAIGTRRPYSNTTALTATRACDDAQCRIIRPKQEFKRCSGCLTANYCSETCQTNDWRRGGHRQTCDDLSFRREEYSSISPKNQSFLRALAHHEYMTRRAEIAQKHLRSKQLYPSEVLCTVFDFTVGTGTVSKPIAVQSTLEYDLRLHIRLEHGEHDEAHVVDFTHIYLIPDLSFDTLPILPGGDMVSLEAFVFAI
ncbi:hypothetical protein C8R45DRAFT_1160157 [Mycena sanguinolenta]|nr:hypothetical protein C8R45DRAFT_1160157 [Mycena sanguinolenta]